LQSHPFLTFFDDFATQRQPYRLKHNIDIGESVKNYTKALL